MPFSVSSAIPLNVDMKEVALVPNPVPEAAIKGLPDPQGAGGGCCTMCQDALITHSPEGDSIPVSSNSTSEGEGITRTGGGRCNELP